MLAVVLSVLMYSAWVLAYIPAIPTNDTNAVNQTDMSRLVMNWPDGTYSSNISYQLAKSNSTGFLRGALVHFSELHLNSESTNTPWIALVNCDANTTDASLQDDIFTLARDRGAVAALLYSNTSEACLINPEYASPDNFEQILDIFATKSKSSAQLILSQFSNLHNISFMTYDPTMLNNSLDSVLTSFFTDNITSGFIIAALRAANSSTPIDGSDPGDNSNPPPGGGGRGNPNTGLAMIVLYAITGCVCGLFIIVIITGAVRAIRHPERYGPRAAGVNGHGAPIGGQTRTGGLGRAILETFPLVKFGQVTDIPLEQKADMENPAYLELTTRLDSEKDPERKETDGTGTTSIFTPTFTTSRGAELSSGGEPSSPSRDPGESSKPISEQADVQPSAMGHETCPICIVDFEAGDDIRVLPCNGKHKFHQTCVDPWLLELSSSCPLCREDFHARESMLSRTDENSAEHVAEAPAMETPAVGRPTRLSGYLRFARRNRDTRIVDSSTGTEDASSTT
ncbi:hypothetical protein BU17DRAFT_53477 [Hysterangium stoloniferum]|nr:hypothetical protein BU17DRAFT_53477 [Hysterangium stoloniferum]